MIQASGKINIGSTIQKELVLDKLTSTGRRLSSRFDKRGVQWISWDRFDICRWYRQSDWEENFNPTHTLADFNLDSEGNELPTFKDGDRVVCDEALTAYIRMGRFDLAQGDSKAPLNDLSISDKTGSTKWLWMVGQGINLAVNTDGSVVGGDGKSIAGHVLHAPTFGNLKAGDPNPFVVGMEVEREGMKGMVEEVDDGPSVKVDWVDHHRQWTGWGDGSLEIESLYSNINTIFPLTEPAPTYQFGDKVKCGALNDPRYVFAHSNGLVAVMTEEQIGYVKDGQAVTICTAIDEVVSPWPESETIDIGLDPEWGDATVHPEGIKIGCQVVRFDAFDKLAAAVAQIRKA